MCLASDVAAAGGTLAGAFVLGPFGADVESVRISLDGLEALAGRPVDAARLAYEEQARESPMAAVEGHAYPFVIDVPERAFPSIVASDWSLVWRVHVEALRWLQRAAVDVPVTISRYVEAAPTAGASPPPLLASDTLRTLWGEVAAASGLVLSETGAMGGTRAGTEVAVWREPGRPAHVCGELRYASLHLGLRIRARRLLELGAGCVVRLPEGDAGAATHGWMERHRLAGRIEEQTAAFLEDGVMAALVPLGDVSMEDERATARWRDAGTARDRVAGFVARLLALAEALAAARARIRPPPAFTGARPAWEALAARMQGELEPARMVVHGRWAGLRAEVRTVWSGKDQPVQTTVSIHPELVWRGAEDEAVAEARQAVLDGSQAERVQIDREGIFARLPAPIADPAPAIDVLDLLARVAEAMRGTTGPYR